MRKCVKRWGGGGADICLHLGAEITFGCSALAGEKLEMRAARACFVSK